MPYTVASVPYINAIPLTDAMAHWPDEIQVFYDVPSKLPAYLETGEAEAVLVSSIDGLRHPGRQLAAGVCIGSDGPVRSVRLFSKVPPSEIRRLAFDASSMTSNRLAEIVLKDGYGACPDVVICPPDLDGMLAEADACVLIGDIGMRTEGAGLWILDLGEEWTRLTGLPFLWAGWIGNGAMTPELVDLLLRAREASDLGKVTDEVTRPMLSEVEWRVIDLAASRSHFPRELVREYYRDIMVYDIDARMMEGYREFQRRLLAMGHVECRHFPALILPKQIVG